MTQNDADMTQNDARMTQANHGNYRTKHRKSWALRVFQRDCDDAMTQMTQEFLLCTTLSAFSLFFLFVSKREILRHCVMEVTKRRS
jgi:hypothetical protein